MPRLRKMSRKPPKLYPIEEKSSDTPTEKKVPECMPPLKPGGANNSTSSTSTADKSILPVLRRVTPRRNFLNCNGTNRRNRFISQGSTASGSTDSPGIRNLTSPKPESGSTNGCGDGNAGEQTEATATIVASSTTKVNGTISNGLSSKSNEPSRSLRRQRSLDIVDTGGTTEGGNFLKSDSQQQTISINGKKVDSSLTNSETTSVSISNSQTTSNLKRTRRLSQTGLVSNLLNKSVNISSPNPSDSETDTSNTIKDGEHNILDNNSSESETNNKSIQDNPNPNDQDSESTTAINELISGIPKIIREGDTVIKSYTDEKTGKIVVFEKGMNLEVCDFGSGKWYPAKVSSVSWEKREILVHYSNWSSRFDEWINMENSRLRPSKTTNVVKLTFRVGERVEAVWRKDSKKYFGTITQTLANDVYDVLFDDGLKIKRTANQLFKVSQTEPQPPLPVAKGVLEDTEEKPAEPKVEMETSKPIRVKRRSIKPSRLLERPAKPPTASQNKERKAASEVPKAETETVDTAEIIPTSQAALPPPPAPSRPRHFSVFDLPSGELGKRKRSVQDYNILAKGNVRVSRRPRSEGAGLTPTTPLASATDGENVPNLQRLTTPTTESLEGVVAPPITSAPTPSRRRKSTAVSKVAVLDTTDETCQNDKPATSVLTEVADTPTEVEKIEAPTTKKRRQPSSSSSNVPDTPVPPEVKAVTPAKPDTAPSVTDSTELSSASSLPQAASQTPAALPVVRRPRSMGSVLALLPSPQISSDANKDSKVDSGFVDESGNRIIIEQNEVDGFWKCPLKNCGKNFRKDNLLQMHFKHYHPELKRTIEVANVVQMAQARTAFEGYVVDHHASWPKSAEQPHTRESSPVGKASSGDLPSHDEVQESQKKSVKTTPPKDSPIEKPISQVKPVPDLFPSKPGGAEKQGEATPGTSTALTQSPRLRQGNRRSFVWMKSGYRRSTTATTTPRKRISQMSTKVAEVAMGTENQKKNRLSDANTLAKHSVDVGSSEVVDSSSSLSISNTPSPSLTSDQKSEFSIESCSGSSSSEPYLVPPYGEAEPLPHGRPRGRWSKSQFRRSLMNSTMRRVGPTMVPNTTSMLLKKRLGNYRKFIGKRSRQKKISILSRISSGRMRVILESLNQRFLKRKRFIAIRRGRDVKVDVINCVCSNKTEFGLMIQCEICLCWQHGSCFNVQTNSQLPDFYACQSCSEPEKARISRKFEWAESEFYKFGKLPSFPFASSFPKEDARIMKMCTNLTSDLAESYSMIKSLKVKQRICFSNPDHPQLYQWNMERPPPQEEIQRDKFNKYFQPVLRRLLLESKSDATYQDKLRKLAERRIKLRKYSEAIDSAKSTIKKKLGYRAAAFLDYMCESVLNEMVKQRRREDDMAKDASEGSGVNKRFAQHAYHRLMKVRDEIVRKQQLESRPLGPNISPTKSNLQLTSPLKTSQQSFMNGAHVNFSLKGATTSHSANGLQKDVSANIKDFHLLRKYLKERRTIDSNIQLTIQRMTQEFPDDWRNLMKLSRGFVEESSNKEEGRMKWVSSVIVTFNNMKILLKQIYSEGNLQRQKMCASEFEKSTIKLFDLFGIGLTEERLEGKKESPKVKNRRIRGLETLDMVQDSSVNLDELKLAEIPPGIEEERGEIMERITLPNTSDTDTAESTLSKTKHEEKVPDLSSGGPQASSTERQEERLPRKELLFKARGLDGRFSMDFSGSLNLQEAVENLSDFEMDECGEENVELKLPVCEEADEQDPAYTGIIPVPPASKITPLVCRKNLVRDILLQQQQIDLYLDKIEGQVIKLASQSHCGSAASSMKPADLSLQREKMLHSLEMVTRLTKTMIGENDIIPRSTQDDMDVSEATVTDSDLDSSSDSDDDDTSNYSGTDTETADEGDMFSGDDDLLDV